MLEWRVDLAELQQAQRANLRVMAACRAGGVLGQVIREATAEAHRYAVSITHVWRDRGGGLRASHRIEMQPAGPTGRIYIDPAAVNPRGQRPAGYGPAEHARGGSHRFYERVREERGATIAQRAGETLLRAFP